MHYGTSQRAKSTFRLIGKGFEITLYNPEGPTTYVLSLYETPPGKGAEARGKAAYRELQQALMTPSETCQS